MEDDNRSPRDYSLASSILGWQALANLVTARDAIEQARDSINQARIKLMACDFDLPALSFVELSTDSMDDRIEILSGILLAHLPDDIFDEDSDGTAGAADL